MVTFDHCRFARAFLYWAMRRRLLAFPEFKALMDGIWRSECRIQACQGKEVFASFGLAHRIASKSGHDGHRSRTAYKCRVCGGYHVGSRSTVQRKKRARIRLERMEMELA